MNKILAEMDFGAMLGTVEAQTQTGSEVLNKYKSHLMANESTCALVNNFIKEASQHRYDNGINKVLEAVADYVNCNKTVWALSSACESINNNTSSYNYLNRNAAKQVEKLLEMSEEDVVKYIKAGALKNIMYCESFRNIAKQVFNEHPIIESTAEYTVAHPVSMVENMGDGVCFEVCGNLYKMTNEKELIECAWNEVSNTFKVITNLLESNYATVDNEQISVKIGETEYIIKEENKVTRIGKDNTLELTAEQLRDNSRLMVMATTPRHKAQVAAILEAVALVSENYSQIVNMDNVSIYSTNRDKFVVVEAGTDLYATLIQSNHNQKWTINENVVSALSFIKSKTNVTLSDRYQSLVESHLESVSIEEKQQMEEDLKSQTIQSYKERIAALTEKFKNDPVKLAILSKLAQDLNNE